MGTIPASIIGASLLALLPAASVLAQDRDAGIKALLSSDYVEAARILTPLA